MNDELVRELRLRIDAYQATEPRSPIKQFAKDGMPSLRTEQAIHAWLRGETMPKAVRTWLETPLDNSDG